MKLLFIPILLIAFSSVLIAQGKDDVDTAAAANKQLLTMFTKMDKDLDGKLSQDESEMRDRNEFEKVDKNLDGEISKEEFGILLKNGKPSNGSIGVIATPIK